MKFFKDHQAKAATPVCVSNSFEALASPTTLGNMTPDSLFLKLPAELRNMVYRHALEPIHLRTYEYPQQERQLNRHSPLLNINLPAVNSTMKPGKLSSETAISTFQPNFTVRHLKTEDRDDLYRLVYLPSDMLITTSVHGGYIWSL
jgi:hypothetical protein